jgi:tetratricopeptide (TPR) repeat protein
MSVKTALRRAGYMKRSLLCSVGAVLLAVSAWAQAPPDWMQQFQQAYALLQNGNLPGATQSFDALWKSYPRESELAFAIGTALDSTGHHREATPWYLQTLKLNPQLTPAYNNLALNYVSQGDFEKALPLLRKVTRLDPRNEQALYNLGLVHLQLKHYREAAQAFRRAHELKPGERDPLLRLAYTMFHLGEYKQTAGALLKAGAPRDSAVDYYLLLGSAQALSGDLPAAVKTLQTAVRAAPLRPEPYYRLALVFLEGYRDQDALQVLAAGLRQIPDSPLLLFATGTVHEVGGRYQQAIDYLRKSVGAKADQAEVWSELGDLYVKVGRYEQAADAYQGAISQGGGSETVVKYADLLTRQGQFAEAEMLLVQVLKKKDNLVQAYVVLGKLHNAQKQYARAETELRRAVELDPDSADAHFFLTGVLARQGRADEAKQEGELAAQKKAVLRERERASLLRAVLVPETTGSRPARPPAHVKRQ